MSPCSRVFMLARTYVRQRTERACRHVAAHPRLRGDELGGVAQPLRLGQALELLQRVVLDLADAFAGHAEGPTDLLEGPRLVALEPIAHLDHLALALG